MSRFEEPPSPLSPYRKHRHYSMDVPHRDRPIDPLSSSSTPDRQDRPARLARHLGKPPVHSRGGSGSIQRNRKLSISVKTRNKDESSGVTTPQSASLGRSPSRSGSRTPASTIQTPKSNASSASSRRSSRVPDSAKEGQTHRKMTRNVSSPVALRALRGSPTHDNAIPKWMQSDQGAPTSLLHPYVPVHLFQTLSSLHATRQQVTLPAVEHLRGAVMMVDIAGFTSFSERICSRSHTDGEPSFLPVEEISRILKRFFTQMIDVIYHHGGDVVKFAGDALLVMWTTATKLEDTSSQPHTVSDLVLRATACALALKRQCSGHTVDGDIKLLLHTAIGSGRFCGVHLGGFHDTCEYLLEPDPDAPEDMSSFLKSCHYSHGQDIVLTGAAVESLGNLVRTSPCEANPSFATFQGFTEQFRAIGFRPAALCRPLVLKLDHITPPEVAKRLRRYLSAPVLERLDYKQGKSIEELRIVTTLFIGLPKQSVCPDGLQAYQTLITYIQKTAFQYDGFVRQVITDDKGTSVILVFGVLSSENATVRGAQAAVRIQEDFIRECIDIKIGLTTGVVYCGSIGHHTRCEYLVLGDVVNTAARLLAAVTPEMQARSGVLCDQATMDGVLTFYASNTQARRNLAFSDTIPLRLKGKHGDVPTYQVWFAPEKDSLVHDIIHPPALPALPCVTHLEEQRRVQELVEAAYNLPQHKRSYTEESLLKQTLHRSWSTKSDLCSDRDSFDSDSSDSEAEFKCGSSKLSSLSSTSALAVRRRKAKHSCLVLEGGENMGKEDLVHVVKARCAALDMTLVSGSGDAIERHLPYHAWGRIVAKLLYLLLSEPYDPPPISTEDPVDTGTSAQVLQSHVLEEALDRLSETDTVSEVSASDAASAGASMMSQAVMSSCAKVMDALRQFFNMELVASDNTAWPISPWLLTFFPVLNSVVPGLNLPATKHSQLVAVFPTSKQHLVINDLIVCLLEAVSRRKQANQQGTFSKIVVLIEEYQWLDSPSQHLLLYMVRKIEHAVLPVIACRPTPQNGLSVFFKMLKLDRFTTSELPLGSPTRHSPSPLSPLCKSPLTSSAISPNRHLSLIARRNSLFGGVMNEPASPRHRDSVPSPGTGNSRYRPPLVRVRSTPSRRQYQTLDVELGPRSRPQNKSRANSMNESLSPIRTKPNLARRSSLPGQPVKGGHGSALSRRILQAFSDIPANQKDKDRLTPTLYIPVRALNKEEVRRIITTEVNATTLSKVAFKGIWKLCEGNKLCLLELLHELVDSGDLVVNKGRCSLRSAHEALRLPLPESIKRDVRTRFDTVSQDLQILMKIACVFQSRIPLRVIHAIFPRKNSASLVHMTDNFFALCEAGWMRCVNNRPGVQQMDYEFVFTPSFTKNVIYERTTAQHRAHYHELVAMWYNDMRRDLNMIEKRIVVHHWKMAAENAPAMKHVFHKRASMYSRDQDRSELEVQQASAWSREPMSAPAREVRTKPKRSNTVL